MWEVQKRSKSPIAVVTRAQDDPSHLTSRRGILTNTLDSISTQETQEVGFLYHTHSVADSF
jgi:hypothetical protein